MFDFNKGDTTYPLPHWDVLSDKSKWPKFVHSIADALPVNPVPPDALAKPTPKDTGFSFGLSQEQATKTFKEMELADTTKPNEQMKAASAVCYVDCLIVYKTI